MNAHNDHVERKQNAAASAIDVWENEGGAHGHGALDHHYGRRVEVDRSWTLSLNRRSEARFQDEVA